MKFKDVMIRGEKKRKKSNSYVPRAWRWTMASVIDVAEEYFFSVCILLEGLFKEITLYWWAIRDHLTILMSVVVAPILLPFKLEFGNGVALYSS